MSNELLTILEYIEQERGISRESTVRALENAILTASRKSIHPASELKVKIDPPTGKIQAWATLEVVDGIPNSDQLTLARAQELYPEVKVGDKVEWEVTPKNFGRIAAQTAKQAIIQQLRKAEKDNVTEVFSDRVGQILYGTVTDVEAGNVIIDFQKASGIMSVKDRIHDEQYSNGDSVTALLVRIDTNTSGPSLIVSRTSPNFVARLFEREVSEIRDNLVEIKAIAREAGKRTKIAVASNDPRVDPVGACVGLRGTRVRRITDELNNERIDIVPWNEDIKKFAANALLPAKVQSVEVDEEKHELRVIVADDQSKVAFGRKAQNVRLSAKLLGWNIKLCDENIKSRGPSIAEQIQIASEKLAEAAGISLATAGKLVAAGFVTVDGLKAADPEAFNSVEGLDVSEVLAAVERLNG
ncbi:MAG: transcription termination factor NusA [Lentisphaeria bacterium]|nr:transcription termination factor NusA [Lentisphaeria bacterium]